MDLQALLTPLENSEQGTGKDLRNENTGASAYHRLRDARGAARAEERARDAEGDPESADTANWREVISTGSRALTTQTKDLEIAAWMTEALIRCDGLVGLSKGAQLIAGLCDAFWPVLFPPPDEEGDDPLEPRRTPIEGLSGVSNDGTILQPLRRLALFRRADGTPVGLYQWEQSEKAAGLPEERRNAYYVNGGPESDTLRAEARIDRAFMVQRGREVAEAVESWRALDESLMTHFGDSAPSLRKVRDLLDAILKVVTQLGGVPSSDSAADESATDEDEGEAAPDASGTHAAPGVVARATGTGAMTRESALRQLNQIANYFRQAEPHSPLAYTLEEAVRRANMSLAELLAEVLPDAEVRRGMLERLGMRAKPPDGSEAGT